MVALPYVLAALLVLTPVACSSAGPGAGPAAAAAPAPVTTGGAASTTTRPDEAGRVARTGDDRPARNADQIVRALAAAIPTARRGIVYTELTDPNELLGTPDAYLSKAAFTDTRIDPAGADDTEVGSIELGGSVEVFADESDARARQQYIQETIADLPIDVSEHSYLHGTVLLRVSRHLAPAQAAEYEAALLAL